MRFARVMKFFFFCLKLIIKSSMNTKNQFNNIVFFFREFQPMASTPDDNSLSSDQDINRFLV